MPIAETVEILADCIAESNTPLSPWERTLCDALKQLPDFRDRHALDEWETLFHDAWDAGSNAAENLNLYFSTSQLFYLVFELVQSNLYTAFPAGGPLGELNVLVHKLTVQNAISVPPNLDVSEW
ncbi:hypothetical protein LF1_56320 [Rubripirellula obstinata]|uniref:Uncharacterized protein n=1 Tax=Rubripirellula obstinata TaxID=406547 RepID=A0A5B1CBX0_9BACT|nr:hypothetical protein LF1_56320 [Rubripirellula obstinata]